MQAAFLLAVYVVTTAAMQLIGFLISQLIDYQMPTFGLMTFLILFIAAFGIAWPISVWIAETVMRRYGVEIEQMDKRAI